MIQWMHTLSKSWIATLLMGGLTLSFVVWGIGFDQFGLGGSTAVATVGSTEIDQQAFSLAYRNFVRAQGQRMGTELTPEMAQKMGLPQVALQQIVSRTALDNQATALGLTTPDSAIRDSVRAMPAFRGPAGQFDHDTFTRALQTIGYDEKQFLAEIRGDMTRSQLTGAVEGNFTIPAAYAQAIFLFINERRAADYVILSPEAAGDVPPPSDAVLAAYVKANATRFSTPEYRDADYAQIAPADVMGQVNVTDAMIQQQYAAMKDTYVVPEKRDIQQIEFKTEAEAKDARARLQAGTTFEALAAAHGLTPAQMSLGTLTQDGLPDPERARAIFALPLNEASQPLKTILGGWVLARVTRIEAGSNHTLDQVKDDIRKDITTRLAAAKVVDAVNAYSDARNAGDDLATAAKKSGLKTGRLKAVDANGMMPDGKRSDAPADPEFLTALFKAEVGGDSEPVQTRSGTYYAILVNGITPPKLKPMDVVRTDAIAAWSSEKRTGLLAEKARALATQAGKDKSLDSIAKSLGVTVQHSPALSRGTNDTMFSAGLTQQIFDAAPGGVVYGPQGLSGNFLIARVTGIAHPPLNPRDPGLQNGVAQLSQTVVGDLTIALANAARAQQGVKVNQKLVDSAVGGGQ